MLRATEDVDLLLRAERMSPSYDRAYDERVPPRRSGEGDRQAIARDEGLIRLETGARDVEVQDHARAFPPGSLAPESDAQADGTPSMRAKMRSRTVRGHRIADNIMMKGLPRAKRLGPTRRLQVAWRAFSLRVGVFEQASVRMVRVQ